MALAASRSCLVRGLLRTAADENRHSLHDFLRGLSRDELECLAEFQGAAVLEAENYEARNLYRLMADFFDPNICERWQNPDDRAHKTFVVLAYLDQLDQSVAPAPRVKILKAS